MTNNIFLINYKVELLIIKLSSLGQQHFNNHGRRIGSMSTISAHDTISNAVYSSCSHRSCL